MAKEIVKHFRLTAEEAEAFSRLAGEAGMKEAEYFRLLITQKPNDYPEVRSGLKSLINEVNRIGWVRAQCDRMQDLESVIIDSRL